MKNELVPGLTPGLAHTLTLTVNDRLLTTAFSPDFSGFAELPPVFATAFMVGFVEWACIETLRPYLDDGMQTVGTHIYLSHVAPTPSGMKVEAYVELVEVRDRVLRFQVDCFDECGLIGSGFHERAVVDTTRFMTRVRERARRVAAEAA